MLKLNIIFHLCILIGHILNVISFLIGSLWYVTCLISFPFLVHFFYKPPRIKFTVIFSSPCLDDENPVFFGARKKPDFLGVEKKPVVSGSVSRVAEPLWKLCCPLASPVTGKCKFPCPGRGFFSAVAVEDAVGAVAFGGDRAVPAAVEENVAAVVGVAGRGFFVSEHPSAFCWPVTSGSSFSGLEAYPPALCSNTATCRVFSGFSRVRIGRIIPIRTQIYSGKILNRRPGPVAPLSTPLKRDPFVKRVISKYPCLVEEMEVDIVENSFDDIDDLCLKLSLLTLEIHPCEDLEMAPTFLSETISPPLPSPIPPTTPYIPISFVFSPPPLLPTLVKYPSPSSSSSNTTTTKSTTVEDSDEAALIAEVSDILDLFEKEEEEEAKIEEAKKKKKASKKRLTNRNF